MILASDLHPRMIVRVDGAPHRVLEATAHAGQGKLHGFVHARLQKLDTGSQTDRRFRLEEKLEEVEVSKRTLEYSFQSGDEFTFMDPETFDQVAIPRPLIGDAHRFLREGLRLSVEFLGEEPLTVVFPETVALRVLSTAEPMHATQTSTMKRAMLENDMAALVPLFIKEGEVVRINVATGRYVERVREGRH